MEAEDVSDNIVSIREDVIHDVIDQYIAPQSLSELWDVPGLEAALEHEFAAKLPVSEWLDSDDALHEAPLRARIVEAIESTYKAKEAEVGAETMRQFEKAVMLQVLDSQWKEHLAAMDYLRQGIHLRGYAQKNPKQEYKRESFEMFSAMLDRIKHEVTGILCKVEVRAPEDVAAVEESRRQSAAMNYQHADASALPQPTDMASAEEEAAQPYVRDGRKVGRNEPCPCGSGKKFKQCHGKLA
jgi:preprotein translocase subunit SecA